MLLKPSMLQGNIMQIGGENMKSIFKRKNPPQNVEDSKENKGYLNEKDRDDFLCYLVLKEAKNTKIFSSILILLIINFVIGAIQILLLLSR